MDSRFENMPVKIEFRLSGSDSDWHGLGAEMLWALPLGGDRYQIDNIPFYVYELSFGDEVAAAPLDPDGQPVFCRVTKRGGHSTYRIFLSNEADEAAFYEFWRPLELIGCSYEKGGEMFFAVDVPPSTDIYAAYGHLERGESEGVWNFEEGHCGHALPDRVSNSLKNY